MSVVNAAAGTRQAYWDMARAALILLGIPFHTALLYRMHGYDVSALSRSPFLTVLSIVIHTFRMPAFFIIAGFFSGMLLARKDPRSWFTGRLTRLGIPLLTGVLLINVLQMAIIPFGLEGAQPASISAATGRFVALLQTPGRHWLSHMWFLVVLLQLSAVAAALHVMVPGMKTWRVGEAGTAFFLRYPRAFLLATMCVIAIFCVGVRVAVSSAGLYDSPVVNLLALNDFLLDLPFFAVGFVLSREEGFLTYFTRPDRVLWGAAFVVVAAMTWVDAAVGGTPAKVVTTGGSAFSGLLMAHVVLSACRRWFTHTSPLAAEFVAGAMVIYIVHHPLLLILGICFFSVSLPAVVEFALICVLTIVISFGLYRLIAQNALLSLLFNGKAVERPARDALARS